jgi:hypothetical protein
MKQQRGMRKAAVSGAVSGNKITQAVLSKIMVTAADAEKMQFFPYTQCYTVTQILCALQEWYKLS